MKRKFISTKGPLYWKYIKTQLIQPGRGVVEVRAVDSTVLGVIDVSETGGITYLGTVVKNVSTLVTTVLGKKVLAGCWDCLYYNGTPLKELTLPVFRQIPTEEPVGYSVWNAMIKEWMKLRVSWNYNGHCKERFQVPNSYVWYLLRNVDMQPHSDKKKRTFPQGMFIVEKYYFFEAHAIAQLFDLREKRYWIEVENSLFEEQYAPQPLPLPLPQPSNTTTNNSNNNIITTTITRPHRIRNLNWCQLAATATASIASSSAVRSCASSSAPTQPLLLPPPRKRSLVVTSSQKKSLCCVLEHYPTLLPETNGGELVIKLKYKTYENGQEM